MISGTSVLEVLVDQAWLKLQQVLSVGEKVSLKVKAAGKTWVILNFNSAFDFRTGLIDWSDSNNLRWPVSLIDIYCNCS